MSHAFWLWKSQWRIMDCKYWENTEHSWRNRERMWSKITFRGTAWGRDRDIFPWRWERKRERLAS